jgi:hypothetical protein
MTDAIANHPPASAVELLSVEARTPRAQLSAVLTTTLPEHGLDRMTPRKIESVLCTSALTAHI